MNQLSNTLVNGFSGYYRDLTRRVHALCEELSEEQFWTRPYVYGNSLGHLTLHVIGNLNYYIGAQIADTGYVRDRPREFTETSPPAKDEVLKQLDQVVDLVVETIEAQTVESWSEKYEAVGAADIVKDRFSIFLNCAAHFQHHIGQMIYLEKEITK
jgi:uncharacterized damage-inducible protein DinB